MVAERLVDSIGVPGILALVLITITTIALKCQLGKPRPRELPERKEEYQQGYKRGPAKDRAHYI